MEVNYKDEEIAKKVQEGDAEAFGIIVDRYEDKLLRYGRRFFSDHDDIADLVQDVFLKTYVNIKNFDIALRFSPWIYRIAHNEFVNALKKKTKSPLSFFDVDVLFPHPVSEENESDRIDKQTLSLMFEKFLNTLDVKYREPIILYYFEDMGYQEIADILHIPISTVGVRIARGKKILKKSYDFFQNKK
ncbi:MAG: RNA polymerase sigma factor [Patescibacteria group bacterium]